MSGSFAYTTIAQTFDYFDRLEKPSITLCNPDKTEIYSLNACYDTSIKLRWNAQSEFSFAYPRFVADQELDAFDYISGKRIVKIENIGYFVITQVIDDFDGSIPIKTVSCLSQESELISKRINLFSGTVTLEELFATTLASAPNWSVASIDSELDGIYRTFDVSDTNIYSFLMDEVAIAYDCVFIFDYNDREIYAIPSTYAANETDIFLSFENLINNTEYKEITDEIITSMYCYGGGDLNIRTVNPLGTNAIYDFTYYKNTEWMTQGLITAINTWKNKVTSYTGSYVSLLTNLSTYQTNLLAYQAELAELQAELAADEQVRDARVQQGLDTTDIEAEIATDERLIDEKQGEISGVQVNIATVTIQLSSINTLLSLDNTDNFTSAQRLELSNFIFENAYENENIIITDSMSFSEQQDQAQELYDAATAVLAKVSIPRYEVTIDSANFLALSDYLPFINQLSLGCQITVDSGRGYFLDTRLLEYSFSYDNIDVFNIVLGNRQRLDNSSFIFSDLFGSAIKSANRSRLKVIDWNDWTTSKPTILNNVVVPVGTVEYGIPADNIKGTITATSALSITNLNVTTGSSNFELSNQGVVLRDPSLYSGSNLGLDGDLSLAGGGAIFFRSGIYIGGAGLEEGSNITTFEDLTAQVFTGGSYFSVSGSFLSNSLRVYVNGLMQRRGYTYDENPDVLSFILYDPTVEGDVLTAEYVELS